MKFKAINDTVIVEIPETQRETKRESGLVLIEDDKSNQTTVTGTVISVGEGKYDYNTGKFIPPPLSVGTKVILSLATGISIDKNYRMVRTDDIFAIVE